MIQTSPTLSVSSARGTTDWHALADRVLEGHRLSRDEAISVIECPDADLLDLLAAVYRVRRHFFGNTVQLYMLMNAKSGLCPEDCGYCSQSKVAESDIPRYNLLSRDKLLAGAQVARERQAKTYCIVISGRAPSEREIRAIETIVPEIKESYGLNICACLGLLTLEQAQRLAACGVDKVNHNLNTSPEHYERICTTHTYDDRVATLRNAKAAGMELCSGGIVGMGEQPRDVVRMAEELRDLGVKSIPVNFLHPIDGTPLSANDSAKGELNPRYCLKTLCMMRLMNPDRELRIAGGRELHLGSMQAFGLYAANSIFVGDYLTTPGQAAAADLKMVEELGFTITRGEEVAITAAATAG